jgi:outer membrane receptor protein involved in Fe transport
VRDEDGGTVAGARVEAVCGARRWETTTGLSGQFSFSGLDAGECAVTAESPLFQPARTSVDLTSRPTAAVFLTLRIRGFSSEVVVTPALGAEEETFHVPAFVSVTTRQDIESRPHQLLPQVLAEEAGVLLQQTTTAQASPIVRGFTGQSNVLLLDGVRVNTASWRLGPSQYFAWIADAVVDRVEVMRGPGSVQYGSDALGATINVLSAQPSFRAGPLHAGGEAEGITGSAATSIGGRAALTIQAPSVAFRFTGHRQDFDDVRPGRGVDSHSAVTRYLGLPASAIGSRLTGTGFTQTGASIAGTVRAGKSGTISTLVLHESQTGASRYDRILGGDGLYRSGFDPQALDFGLVRYRKERLAGLTDVSATLSVNRQSDGRFEQARPGSVFDTQRSTTTVFGYQLQAHRQAGRHRIAMGGELYDERLGASRERRDSLTGAAQPARPDIPDGTSYRSSGIFTQDVFELVPGKLAVRGGMRYARFDFQTRPDEALGVTRERVATQAVTFNAGAVVAITKQLNAVFGAARGFRAANAADLGGVGLSGGGGFTITASRAGELGGLVGTTTGSNAQSTGEPVPELGPEVLYSYEYGVKFRSGRLGGTILGYRLDFHDAIQRRAVVFPSSMIGTVISGFEIVRQDASGLAYIAQDIRPVGTTVNVDHARIHGMEAEADALLGRSWKLRGFFGLSNGHVPQTGEYLRRMPPPMGGAALRWSPVSRALWVEAVMSFAHEQTRLNSADLADARIGGLRTRASIAAFFNGSAVDLGLVRDGVLLATGETLPEVQSRVLGGAASAPLYDRADGFVVFGLRAGLRLSAHVDVTVIGENLTDRNYRVLGSGVDAPGFNVQMVARYRF